MGLVLAFASVFCFIGDNEYAGKGWLLALLSIAFSATGIALGIGALYSNILLYLTCLAFNMITDKYPRSGSGL
jgi:hypothetical protein